MKNFKKNQEINQKQTEKKIYSGKIDDSWEEVDLTEFLKDNPQLISNLKEKYSI